MVEAKLSENTLKTHGAVGIGSASKSPEDSYRHEILSRAEGTRASQKGPLNGAGDPPSFSAGMVDPAHSSRDMLVNLTL